MKARTLGYIVAACAPFWLLALVAILGRNFYSPYEEKEIGEKASQKILAYASPIRYTYTNRNQIEHLDSNVLDEAANRWIKSYKAGKLESIDPISSEDSEVEGFRNEIETNRRFVILSLLRDLDHQSRNQQFDNAASRASQILTICEIAKYNGAQTTSFSAGMQRQVIKHLNVIRPHITAESLQMIDQAIKGINPNPERVKQVAMRLSTLTQFTESEDSPVMPTNKEFQYMLTTTPRHVNVSNNVNPPGLLLAQSYRVAFQEEQKLQASIQLIGLTASRTNLEAKSDLP